MYLFNLLSRAVCFLYLPLLLGLTNTDRRKYGYNHSLEHNGRIVRADSLGTALNIKVVSLLRLAPIGVAFGPDTVDGVPSGLAAGASEKNMKELCFWNPKKNQPAYFTNQKTGDTDGCQNEAVLCIGSKTVWHLCESCAALPAFKRFRSRHRLPNK